jgi:nucleoside phosphorylase
MSKEYFDLVLIVPLELELKEVLTVFPLVENRTTATHFRCTVDTGSSEISALLIHQDGMGQSAAAKALRLTLREYDCGVAICIGIAGALSDDVSLLDVCYSGDVIDVGENARVSDDESGSLSIDFAPTYYSTGKSLTQAINFSRIVPEIKALHDIWAQQQYDFASEELKSNGMAETDSSYPKNSPNSMNGAIVCGPVVVKSEVYRKRLSGIQRKLLAVEMEASGIFSAAQELSPDVECITIRGISDNADKGKTALESISKGAFRSIAARNAATFLKLQLSNRYFVDCVKKRRKSTGESDQSIDPFLEQADSISVIAKRLADQISDKLRELSPEYKLIPRGYRLPLPRLQKTVIAQESEDEADEPLFALDVVKQGTNLLLTLPRTYPDNSLSYVLSEALVTCEFESRQILPFVIDGSQIRPPKHGIQQSQPDFLLKKLCENPSVRIVFLIENPPIQSKTRMSFLISELAEFSNSQNVFVVREGVGDFDVASFANSNNLFSYRVGEISFSEIAHFVQKNFGMDGKESDVVALRIRDTLRRFRLAVHPSYFAGVAKELLSALLVANRRSELLQLAVWPAAGFTDTELRCFDGTGGFKWKERSIRASSSLRR